MTLKKLAIYCSVIVLAAALTFLVHFAINLSLQKPVENNELVYTYVVNVLLASGVVVLIFVLQKKLHHQLGFVFIAGSLLKFACFFILFYPRYNADGVLTRLEFLTFFIPYAICLITESIILSRFFNRLGKLNS